jgi:hypothetical protein
LPAAQGIYVNPTDNRKGQFRAGAALIVLLAALQGCGKIENAVSKRGKSPQTAKAPEDPVELALANMVSAVSSGKSSEDLQLKFELKGKPAVGQPVDIVLALIPGQELDRVLTTFQGSDGLDISAGAKPDPVDHPPVGVPVDYTVTVVAKRDGVFSLSALVLADSRTASVSRTFSVPVIAGSGVAAPAAAADSARVASQ